MPIRSPARRAQDRCQRTAAASATPLLARNRNKAAATCAQQPPTPCRRPAQQVQPRLPSSAQHDPEVAEAVGSGVVPESVEDRPRAMRGPHAIAHVAATRSARRPAGGATARRGKRSSANRKWRAYQSRRERQRGARTGAGGSASAVRAPAQARRWRRVADRDQQRARQRAMEICLV